MKLEQVYIIEHSQISNIRKWRKNNINKRRYYVITKTSVTNNTNAKF